METTSKQFFKLNEKLMVLISGFMIKEYGNQ